MEIPADGHHDGSDGARDPCAGPSAEHVGRVFAILLVSTSSRYLVVGGRVCTFFCNFGWSVLATRSNCLAPGSDLYVDRFYQKTPSNSRRTRVTLHVMRNVEKQNESATMSQVNLFQQNNDEPEAMEHSFFRPESHDADSPLDDQPVSDNFFGEAAAAGDDVHSPSSAIRIGYVLIGVGVMGLLISVTLIIMWMRDRSLHGTKRKYDGQSKRKVAPLEFPESPRVVIVEEEEVAEDADGGDGPNHGQNQMQIV